MAGEDNERRLAAIMSADVAGYSRLMGADEPGTLATLKALRREVFAPQVAAHKGRIVKLMGDGALVEFPSIVQAVDCAVAVQRGLAERDADTAIKLRIGIKLGDIIIEGSDIYGDGVNVAARIQEISDPGGICISGSVYEQVTGKLDQVFDDLGHRKLKNISHPVHVYRVRLSDTPDVSLPGLFDRPPIEKTSLATGQCMCGEIRFEIDQPVIDTGLCHCRMCQRFNSAPFSVWAIFPVEAVRFTTGEPKYYTSSLIGERGFCANCGSSLTMRYYVPDSANLLGILASTLDRPEDYAPTRHVGIEGKMPWLDMNDSLPRERSRDSSDLRQLWEAVGRPDPDDWK